MTALAPPLASAFFTLHPRAPFSHSAPGPFLHSGSVIPTAHPKNSPNRTSKTAKKHAIVTRGLTKQYTISLPIPPATPANHLCRTPLTKGTFGRKRRSATRPHDSSCFRSRRSLPGLNNLADSSGDSGNNPHPNNLREPVKMNPPRKPGGVLEEDNSRFRNPRSLPGRNNLLGSSGVSGNNLHPNNMVEIAQRNTNDEPPQCHVSRGVAVIIRIQIIWWKSRNETVIMNPLTARVLGGYRVSFSSK